MKQKIIWLLVSCLMVLSLVLASCAPAEVKPAAPTEKPTAPTQEKPAPPEEEEVAEEGPEMVKLELTKVDGTVVEKLVEKPRYGGVLKLAPWTDALNFDEVFGHPVNSPTMHLTNEHLIGADWARGHAGTGEAGYTLIMIPGEDIQVGCLIESWELADPETLVYHIRKGVRWHNKPPANGREMTADDVAFSLKRIYTTVTAFMAQNYPWDKNIESITVPDKWTVVVKCVPGRTGMVHGYASMLVKIVPRDAVEKYGDLNDWRNACGTGAFMLVDYVRGSSMTFERNPNYWMNDPLHPQNTLPYLDGVKYLVIPDPSTRAAALRTAQIDLQAGFLAGPALVWDEARQLMDSNPELEWVSFPDGGAPQLFWRMDKPELPFHDVRVRRALHMGIDFQSIIDFYYSGKGQILNYPVLGISEFADMYIPLEELPESTRELFEYNPDKARQLLAEAGYPDGFKTEIVCRAEQADLLSIIIDYWNQIGVDLELDVKEQGAYWSIQLGNLQEQMIIDTTSATTVPFRMFTLIEGQMKNHSMIKDPTIEEAYLRICDNYFDESIQRQTMKELIPYVLDQAYVLQMPAPLLFNGWYPWVKSYHGESEVGYCGSFYTFLNYIWLDQDLREKMTGRR